LALTDALDELVTGGDITPVLAMKVLAEFDRTMASELKLVDCKLALNGKLHTYRFCDNVWTFVLEDVTARSIGSKGVEERYETKLMKIVACDSKLLGDTLVTGSS
jgi:transcription initiation factor TFIIA small subunit